MIAYEVYCNGEKLCLAGIGELGVLTARLKWVSYAPERLRQWREEGRGERDPETLELSVFGGTSNDEHLNWLREARLEVGDEIRVVVVDAPTADPPASQVRSELDVEKMVLEQVRKMAAEFGWQVNE
jgi:hypothetical protein